RPVAGGKLVHNAGEGREVEGSMHVERERYVVGRAPRIESVLDPELFLGIGERCPGAVRQGSQGRQRSAARLFGSSLGEKAGQVGNGRAVEEPAQRDLNAEDLA